MTRGLPLSPIPITWMIHFHTLALASAGATFCSINSVAEKAPYMRLVGGSIPSWSTLLATTTHRERDRLTPSGGVDMHI